eukprot:TRINITY_DN4115_c1_g1_i2.p1 TRINITY_DN4115_c1_g1~~TRINITY_DN4115_c1_g1_i2.p1  ORF type:complete len:276 (-),score=102.12 TRINITY_DN4115_c1_g1_i2:964-1791(-)
MELGQFERALEDASRCVALNKDWFKGHYRRGVALMALNQPEQAVQAFSNGLKLSPGNVDIVINLSRARALLQTTTDQPPAAAPPPITVVESIIREGTKWIGTMFDAASGFTAPYQLDITFVMKESNWAKGFSVAYGQSQSVDVRWKLAANDDTVMVDIKGEQTTATFSGVLDAQAKTIKGQVVPQFGNKKYDFDVVSDMPFELKLFEPGAPPPRELERGGSGRQATRPADTGAADDSRGSRRSPEPSRGRERDWQPERDTRLTQEAKRPKRYYAH